MMCTLLSFYNEPMAFLHHLPATTSAALQFHRIDF